MQRQRAERDPGRAADCLGAGTDIGSALAARGDEVHFISYALPSRLELPQERVHFHEVVAPSYPLFVSPPYTLALATKMAEVTARARLDLLHVHYALPHAISAILAREMGNGNGVRLRVVTTLHGTDVTIVGMDRSYLPITRWGIETSIVVPGAFTGGTNHFAHSGRPADTQRLAEYDNGPYKSFADDVMKGFASIVPPDADAAAVGEAIVKIVDAPFGKRPSRVHVYPTQDGAEVVNMVCDRVRAELLRRIGLTDVLTPRQLV